MWGTLLITKQLQQFFIIIPSIDLARNEHSSTGRYWTSYFRIIRAIEGAINLELETKTGGSPLSESQLGEAGGRMFSNLNPSGRKGRTIP
jgi:hypothetical protein